MGITRYYPVQGSNKFETTSSVIVDTWRMTSATGNSAAGTWTFKTYPKGACVLAIRGIVTTAFASTASATLQIGFTGKTQLSAAAAKTSIDAVGDVLPGSATSTYGSAYVLTADDTFDFIVGTAPFNAGAMDVSVAYIPPPDGEADSTFKSYTIT